MTMGLGTGLLGREYCKRCCNDDVGNTEIFTASSHHGCYRSVKSAKVKLGKKGMVPVFDRTNSLSRISVMIRN